jgi:hypothetical protein
MKSIKNITTFLREEGQENNDQEGQHPQKLVA